MNNFYRLEFILFLCFGLLGCTSGRPLGRTIILLADNPVQVQQTNQADYILSENWKYLWGRLAADGLGYPEVAVNLARLGDTVSQDPMGRKVRELYTSAFIPRTPTTPTPDTSPNDTPIPRPWYSGFVTDANARKCLAFIQDYAAFFIRAEQIYGVSPAVVSALLYIETKHGGYLGEQNALITLASMSSTTHPAQIPDYLKLLPGSESRLDWVEGKMQERSEWAYRELKALLRYCLDNNLDPVVMPCSIYGAIGLCQFMPSNIPAYAADGNGDGVIDLFFAPDAIASACNYLQRHGWRATLGISEQITVLRRYNNSATYANTILALAYKTAQLPGYAELYNAAAR